MKKINKSVSDNPEIQTPKQYQSNVNKKYIHGYSRCIRNTNRAMLDLFSDVTIINEDDNKIYPIPIIWGTQEKAVIYAFGEQFVKNPDRQGQGLVDRVKLPVMAIMGGDISLAENRYVFHEANRKVAYGQEKRPFDVVYRVSKGIPVDMKFKLTLWSKYYEHLMQMVEQIMQKFSPIAYIKPEGIPWETPVKMVSSANNVNEDVGDRQVRILKYSFDFNAESHIIQPIRRDKTVQKISQKFVLMGDLMSSSQGEIETITEEFDENDTHKHPLI